MTEAQITSAVIGIDPGIIGGWAVVAADGSLVAAGDLPIAGTGAQRMVSGPLLAIALSTYRDGARAMVEQVSAMPKQGVSSSFKFGRAVGIAEGVCDGLGIPVSWVRPAKWKKALGLGADKEQSRQRAIRQWPGRASLFARKKDHGRAEAALIALYSIEKRAGTDAEASSSPAGSGAVAIPAANPPEEAPEVTGTDRGAGGSPASQEATGKSAGPSGSAAPTLKELIRPVPDARDLIEEPAQPAPAARA